MSFMLSFEFLFFINQCNTVTLCTKDYEGSLKFLCDDINICYFENSYGIYANW